jgi:chromosome segregation ATPase
VDDIEARHAALVERDLLVGLEAEADAARAHADRLQADLDVARGRLDRKNARIKQLAARVKELEARDPAGSGVLHRAVGRVTRRR